MKTRSHQREDTGLRRLQSHSSSFEAFSCTIDEFFKGLIATVGPPQRPEGARPEAAPEPGETAHLAQKDAGSPLSRAGGGLGGPAAAGAAGPGDSGSRARRQQGGSGPRVENGAAGRNPGGYSSAVRTGAA